MKTRLKLKPKKKVSAAPKKKVMEPGAFTLPPQATDDIQLLDTETTVLLEMSKPNLFRDAIKSSKVKFVEEIQELADQCGLRAEMRVYFTFKLKE